MKNKSTKSTFYYFYSISMIFIITVLLSPFYIDYNNQTPAILNQKNDYEHLWKQVEKELSNGKPKSALAITKNIYQKAKSENNSPQLCKSIMYHANLNQQLEKDHITANFDLWNQEIDSAKPPLKNVLHALYGNFLHKHYINNQYRINQRTIDATKDSKLNILLWDTQKYADEIDVNFEKSLMQKSLLQSTSINTYSPIFSDTFDIEFRPTLYDFIGHFAIDFYSNAMINVAKPTDQFIINQAESLSSYQEFINYKYHTTEHNSFLLKALHIYQKLIRHQTNNKHSNALIDTDLKRLNFAYNHGSIDDREYIFIKTLRELNTEFLKNSTSSLIASKLANHYYKLGEKYQNGHQKYGTDSYKNYFVTADNLCDKTIALHPKSKGSAMCKNLKESIHSKRLSLRLEQVVLPNEAILSNISYKEIETIHVRIVRMNTERNKKYHDLLYNKNNYVRNENKASKYLLTLPIVHELSYNLPQSGDFRHNTIEIALPKMPLGEYFVLASDIRSFSKTEISFSLVKLHVSNLSLVNQIGDNKSGTEIFTVVDRTTGQPIPNVTCNLYARNRGYSSFPRYYKSLKTLKDGVLPFHSDLNYTHFEIEIVTEKDSLWLKDYHAFSHKKNKPHRTQEEVIFFTDRKIYRPGQTVYFKGIFYTRDKDGRPFIGKNKSLEVSLRNTNHKIENTQNYLTNEFGTFSGQFILPNSGLLGPMHIVSPRLGSINIRVEEYKRPKFEVLLDSIPQSVALNEEIEVMGKAISFTTAPLSDAMVKYKVIRQAEYPYWKYFQSGPYRPLPHSPELQIIDGTTTTSQDGTFSIPFTTIPDPNINQQDMPIFNYRILADVTDSNGETQSHSTVFRVGFTSLIIEAELEETIKTKENNIIKINSTDLNGNKVHAKGKLEIFSINQDIVIYKNRYWNHPSLNNMVEDKFNEIFPHYNYNDIENPMIEKIPSIAIGFDTEKNSNVHINTEDLSPGKYLIKISSIDKNKQTVIKEYTRVVYNPKSKKSPTNDIVWTKTSKTSLHPGENFELDMYSNLKSVWVFLAIKKFNKAISYRWIHLKSLEKINIPIYESDRGGFSVSYSIIHNNRYIDKSFVIGVPWTNKQLQVSLESFRDKLLPGQKEQWKLKISGPNKDKVAAEMLATMYDASLDAFSSNSYNVNLWPRNYTYYRQRAFGFAAKGARHFGNPINNNRHFNFEAIKYPQLILQNRFHSFYHIDGNAYEEVIVSSGIRNKNKTESQIQSEAPMAGDDMAFVTFKNESILSEKPTEIYQKQKLQIRENLDETVFFYPHLQTDKEGNLIINFTMNEALTKWKFLYIAHTKDLATSNGHHEILTKKDLMIIPNTTRFFREKDTLYLSAKISNLTDKVINAQAKLDLIDPKNQQRIKLLNKNEISVTILANQSKSVTFSFVVPNVDQVSLIEHTFSVISKKHSDAERNITPVITNRVLVTETLPMFVKSKETKKYTFDRIDRLSKSPTLNTHKFTLEFTSNPTWYVVQALPYLHNQNTNTAFGAFYSLYTNAIAHKIVKSNPKIEKIFKQWQHLNSEALLSNLEKNIELKQALLNETPWVFDAESETQQKKNIALLFNTNKVAQEQAQAISELQRLQNSQGGFSWYPNGPTNPYITQSITIGLSRLLHIQAFEEELISQVQSIIRKTIKYLDDYHYDLYRRYKIKEYNPLNTRYLFARSFTDPQNPNAIFHVPFQSNNKEAYDFYTNNSIKKWNKISMYSQAILALSLHRQGKPEVPQKILTSFKEKALHDPELGAFYKSKSSYQWYRLPIETHASIIQAFAQINPLDQIIDELKLHLLSHKRTNKWSTTSSTSEAIYALLTNGSNWLENTQPVQIKTELSAEIDQQIVKVNSQSETGTGYFKTTFDNKTSTQHLKEWNIMNPNNQVAWGAAYWQYFQDFDKVEHFKQTPLKIQKELYLVSNDSRQDVLTHITSKHPIHIGNLVRVKIIITVDRPMSFVHMRDYRASGFEPTTTLSQYKNQAGLWYYQSSKDITTEFSFDYLPTGTHTFEYNLRASHKGHFSNGITSIQSAYAPEFTSHSKGINIIIK